MNTYELKLYSMIYIHLFIWLFAIFAWIFNKQKIALILLTCIFIFQCLPFHALIKNKLEFIKKNKEHLKKVDDLPVPKRLVSEYQYFADTLNMSYEEFIDLFSYLEYYETSVFPIGIIKKLYYTFEEKTFANPLSPQGLILLGFITNSFLG